MTNLTNRRFCFKKEERLCSKRIIETLFDGGSKSFSAFPLRAVFRPLEGKEGVPVSVLISVSKKHFKRAVKRNRIKRQIREAYRKNKYLLYEAATQETCPHIAIAFLWQADELFSSEQIESKMKNLLCRVSEYLIKEYQNHHEEDNHSDS